MYLASMHVMIKRVVLYYYIYYINYIVFDFEYIYTHVMEWMTFVFLRLANE